MCDGGCGWWNDGGVSGWNGEAAVKSKCCLFFYQTCHNLHKLPDVWRRLFGIEQAVRDGVIASPVARERHEGRVDFRPNIGGNHGMPRGGCIVEDADVIGRYIVDMDLRVCGFKLIAQAVDLNCVAPLHHEERLAVEVGQHQPLAACQRMIDGNGHRQGKLADFEGIDFIFP